MKFTRILLLIVFVFTNIYAHSQNTNQVRKRGPEDSYSRSSLSYLLLDFYDDKYSHLLRGSVDNLSIPTKFDSNNIDTKHIEAPYSHIINPNSAPINKRAKIEQALKKENYAAKIMKYWWQVKEDSSYSTDLIKKRGLYNASDQDVYRVDATKAGRSRLADAGLKLLGNSYVIVFDFNSIKTKKEIYDEIDAKARKKAKKNSTTFKPVKRTDNGFKGQLTSYLFKLNYSDTIQGYLDESFIDEKKIDLSKFEQIFNNVSSPYKYVMGQTFTVEGAQLNPGEPNAPKRQKSQPELMKQLVKSGFYKTLDVLDQRVSAFIVKSSVCSSYPVKSKIGRKEGIRHERKFIVWEYVEKNNKNVVAKRKGTIRARHVVDNRNDKLGQTQESEFYQIGGGRIDQGMTLQERRDLGIGVTAGYGTLGLNLSLDLNVGQLLDIPVKQLKIYGELLMSSNKYEDIKVVDGSTMDADENFGEMITVIGLLKEYPFLRGNLRLGWNLGFGGETVSWKAKDTNPYYDEDKEESISALGISWGGRLCVNLFSPSLHLIASVGGYHFFDATYSTGIEDEEGIELGVKTKDIFPGKKSIHMGLSLRLSF